MMDFGDLLLRAAVEWRGKPLLFTSGALGDVGNDFNVAFVGADWSMDTVSRSLAFEYFAGLIFNGDFEDLETLQGLVASWLLRPDIIMTVPESMLYIDGRPFPRDVGLYYDDEKALWHSLQEAHPGSDLYYTRYYVTVKYYPRQHPSIQYYLSAIGTRIGRIMREFLWFGSDSLIGEWVVERPVEPFKVGDVFTSKARNGAWEFGNTGQDTLNYIEGEKAMDRPYPNPTRTAETDNGYVFANWAQGKYGLTEGH